MFKFLEFYYTNALYFYRRLDGYGEKWRASGASIFWLVGACMLSFNIIQNFTGVVASTVRRLIPGVINDDAALYVVSTVFALIMNYFWLWKRTRILENRYAFLENNNSRWIVAFGTFMSLLFVLSCGYGRVNFWGSLALASLILIVQELLFLALSNNRMKK